LSAAWAEGTKIPATSQAVKSRRRPERIVRRNVGREHTNGMRMSFWN
jgi:hypothetical protein